MKKLLTLICLFTLFSIPIYAQTQGVHQEDRPHSSGDDGVAVLFKRCDVAAVSSGTDGDYTIPCIDANGRILISGTVTVDVSTLATQATLAAINAKLPDALGAGGGIKVDGSGTALPVSGTVTVNAGTNLNTSALALEAGGNLATTATNTGTIAGAVSSSKMATKSASGDFADGAVTTLGAKADAKSSDTDTTAITVMQVLKQLSYESQLANTRVAYDPCNSASKTVKAISQIDDTELVALSGTTVVYICHIELVAAAADIVNVVSGTGDVCGTATAALAGSTTQANGMSFADNGGYVAGDGSATIYKGAAGHAICLTQNGTSRLAGSISYVQQ